MAKFQNPSKLSKEEQEIMLVNLCRALACLNDPEEAARFLRDLLSSQEAEMLAKRLRVAELLLKGKTYAQISIELKIGSNTIAKIHEWLKLSGDGFRLVIERKRDNRPKEKEEIDFSNFSWRNVKRKYPVYFWPQIVLENVVKTAKYKDKERLRKIINEMDKKSALYKQLSSLVS